ncbi:hypothetical protein [Streptococcus sp. 20925_1_77]|jgi:hypothetical protein|uniref:hypothetical protein n=1 Tax=Streptococcus sp. 20925_1_77 TaxID=3003654 RepID=UPI0028FDDED8|nr:hypothetical protein [Streptococcus parasanguinis]
MADSLKFVVFLNFSDMAGKILHNFSFQTSNLIYWYKKILPLKKPFGEIYKKRKWLENL